LKAQQPVEAVMVQMVKEKMVQRGDAVVRLHAASMGLGRLTLGVFEANTKATVESSECGPIRAMPVPVNGAHQAHA
jgi:hypothetical protein